MIELKRGCTKELPGIKCELCVGGARWPRFATYTAWVIGRPLMQVCSRHRADAEQMWAGALDAEEKAA